MYVKSSSCVNVQKSSELKRFGTTKTGWFTSTTVEMIQYTLHLLFKIFHDSFTVYSIEYFYDGRGEFL